MIDRGSTHGGVMFPTVVLVFALAAPPEPLQIEAGPAALVFHGEGAMSARVSVLDRRVQSADAPSISVKQVTSSAPYIVGRDACGLTFSGFASVEILVSADCPEGRHAETLT